MNLIVHKYGGTSLGSLEKMQHVARHIKNCIEKNEKLVVVVSAMGQQTDELLGMAKFLNPNPSRREVDMLLTAGERISMSLLSIALEAQNVASLSLTGSQVGIITDDNHGNAKIQKILGQRVLDGLNKCHCVIVAGFQGVSSTTKDVTTLGRGGSDLTALALAYALKATNCIIYTDVAGIFRAHPSYFPKASLISRLPWALASYIAQGGAQVLHHRAATLAQRWRVPFEIRRSTTPDTPGTYVGDFPKMEESQILAISHKNDQILAEKTFDNSQSASHTLLTVAQWLRTQDQLPVFAALAHKQVRFVIHKNLLEKLSGFSAMETKPVWSITFTGFYLKQDPKPIHDILDFLYEKIPNLNLEVVLLEDEYALLVGQQNILLEKVLGYINEFLKL